MALCYEDLRAGLTLDEALDAFRDGCNRGPDRLWVTDSWLAPRIERLRHSVTTSLGNEQVEKLRDVVMKREWFDTVVEWLADHADETWAQYERSVRDALLARTWTEFQELYHRFPLEDLWSTSTGFVGLRRRATAQSRTCVATTSCPSCGAASDTLDVGHITILYERPLKHREWTADVTICSRCERAVDWFDDEWRDDWSAVDLAGTSGISTKEAAPVADDRSQSLLDRIQPSKLTEAVAWLRSALSAEEKLQLQSIITAQPLDWVERVHFGFGLGVRNRLRSAGYGEGFFRIANLDDIYIELLRRALANQE